MSRFLPRRRHGLSLTPTPATAPADAVAIHVLGPAAESDAPALAARFAALLPAPPTFTALRWSESISQQTEGAAADGSRQSFTIQARSLEIGLAPVPDVAAFVARLTFADVLSVRGNAITLRLKQGAPGPEALPCST